MLEQCFGSRVTTGYGCAGAVRIRQHEEHIFLPGALQHHSDHHGCKALPGDGLLAAVGKMSDDPGVVDSDGSGHAGGRLLGQPVSSLVLVIADTVSTVRSRIQWGAAASSLLRASRAVRGSTVGQNGGSEARRKPA